MKTYKEFINEGIFDKTPSEELLMSNVSKVSKYLNDFYSNNNFTGDEFGGIGIKYPDQYSAKISLIVDKDFDITKIFNNIKKLVKKDEISVYYSDIEPANNNSPNQVKKNIILSLPDYRMASVDHGLDEKIDLLKMGKYTDKLLNDIDNMIKKNTNGEFRLTLIGESGGKLHLSYFVDGYGVSSRATTETKKYIDNVKKIKKKYQYLLDLIHNKYSFNVDYDCELGPIWGYVNTNGVVGKGVIAQDIILHFVIELPGYLVAAMDHDID